MAPPTKFLKRYRIGVVINVTPHKHRFIVVAGGYQERSVTLAGGYWWHLRAVFRCIGGYQRCLKVQFRWLGRYSWYWDDSRSKQTGGCLW